MLKILIVDDSSTMRKLIRKTVESLGYKVSLEAGNGKEALDLIEADSEINCVFLDINMPVMSGFDLIHELKERGIYERVNVIIASTEVLTLGQDYIDELNVAGVIPKPFKKDEINSILIPLLDMIENRGEAKKQEFEEAILIVDDSISMRKIIKRQLTSINCNNLLEAKNGKEALERIAENMEIKLMFVDINMPVMGGIDLLNHLEKSHLLEAIKVIIISNQKDEIKKALEETKAIAGLEKPFKQKDLYDMIIPILEKIKSGEEDFEKFKDMSCNLDSTCDIENEFEYKESENLELEKENEDKNDEEEVNSEDEDFKGIKLGPDVEQCIDKYLSPYEAYNLKNKNYLEQKKSLDFLRMKRFIITAYNHLMEIDIDLKMGEVAKSKNELFYSEKVYLDLNRKSREPKPVAFEVVFLNQQPDYRHFKAKLEDLKRMQALNKSRASSLHNELKTRKEKILQLKDKESPEYKNEVKEYKAKNKDYADTLYKASTIKEEISEVFGYIEEFKEAYYGHFETVYPTKIKKSENTLLKVLNARCHEFDTTLWTKAKNSSLIRKFFEQSKIAGSFSSQTFLEYFLRSVNKGMANEENKKLFELLDYLKKANDKTISVIMEDTSEVMKIKSIIEGIDKAYKVQGFTSSAKFFEKKFEQDIIIIDYEMKNLELDKILKHHKKDSNFLIVFRRNAKTLIFETMESGLLNTKIKNYLVKPYHVDEKELAKKVVALL